MTTDALRKELIRAILDSLRASAIQEGNAPPVPRLPAPPKLPKCQPHMGLRMYVM